MIFKKVQYLEILRLGDFLSQDHKKIFLFLSWRRFQSV
jgi:hypothetical protein